MAQKLYARLFLLLAVILASLTTAPTASAAPGASKKLHRIVIQKDIYRFSPFTLNINRGDTVIWVNRDIVPHTVVSVDAFTTAGHKNTDHQLLTSDNPKKPAKFRLTFTHSGIFIYYCRFYATLDSHNQPIAPGPQGGIDGTPMMGIIVVS